MLDDGLGLTEAHPILPRLQRRDARQHLTLGLLGHALEPAQQTRLGRPPEVVQRFDADFLVQLLHGPRPDPGDLEQGHQTRRHLFAELVVEGEAARARQLFDLLADCVADAGNAGRLAVEVGARDLDRRMGDRVGGLVVGHGLEDQLAPDLEHVADLVKDARQLAVGECRGRLGGIHRLNVSEARLRRPPALRIAAGSGHPGRRVPISYHRWAWQTRVSCLETAHPVRYGRADRAGCREWRKPGGLRTRLAPTTLATRI